jgi:hypothetical protein
MPSDWIFIAHGLVEGAVGIAALLNTKLAFPGDIAEPSVSRSLLAGQMWSLAIIATAVSAYYVADAPNTDKGKRAIAYGSMTYHIGIVCMCATRYAMGYIAPGTQPHKPIFNVAASIAHTVFAYCFIQWIRKANKASSASKKGN